jgi:6-phosphogluconate dehydrogenase
MKGSAHQNCIKATQNQLILIKENLFKQLHDALYFATVVCYAQGFALLHTASSELEMDVPLPDVVKIWRGGCIIRSAAAK